MTYTLIQSFHREGTVNLQGETFPAVCVVEDDDTGRRYLLSEDGVFDSDDPRDERVMDQALTLGALSNITPHDLLETPIVQDVQVDPFVNLHTHSEFSTLDGLSKIDELVDRAVAMGQTAVAVTDHGVCAGHIQLAQKTEKAGIKALYGVEAYVVNDRFRRPTVPKPKKGDYSDGVEFQYAMDAYEIDQKECRDYYHVILLAETTEGLHNIWAASTEANRTGFYYKPRMDWEVLERYSEGVIATTGCLRGPVAHELAKGDVTQAHMNMMRLAGIFPDRLYAEVQTNGLEKQQYANEWIAHAARENGIPLVAAVDSHYQMCEGKESHQVWIALQTNSDMQDETGLYDDGADYHLFTGDEVRKALINHLPEDVVEEAIDNTSVIAQRCNVEIGAKQVAPVFTSSPERDYERLDEMCRANWGRLTEVPQEEYEARYAKEMELLQEKGFCGYFLMVSDYCRWAREHGILVGPGRGSGGGSLVAFLSEIVGMDPVANGLLFERFLTKGRTSLPDFDVDFPSSKKDMLYAYINGKYGAERVVRVGTRISLKNKGIINDLSRLAEAAVGYIDPDDNKAINKIIDDHEADTAGLGLSWEKLLVQAEDDLAPYVRKYPDLFRLAGTMRGRVKSYGKHPAGVVISTESDLIGALPMRRAEKDEEMVAEYDMDELEWLGFIKFDLLFVGALDRIQNCMDTVAEVYNIKVDPNIWVDEYKDPRVWEMLSEGLTKSVFQVDKSPGTKGCLDYRPSSLAELSDVITLIRPGPQKSGIADIYKRRKLEGEPTSFAHPKLEDVLAQTYGLMLYQEDVMNTCQVLAGYTLEEADGMRRILGKKKVEAIEAEREKFVQGCADQGVDAGDAEPIFDQIVEFAKYSFNRSHAFSYAVVGHWCAWFKANWPLIFYSAILSDPDTDVPALINEARVLGIRVLPPDINLSGRGFTPQPKEVSVRYGLEAIPTIGAAAAEAIIAGQPYADFDDFVERGGVNSGVTEKLIKVGAFDSMHPNRRALEARFQWDQVDSQVCRWKDESHLGPNGLPCTFDWSAVPIQMNKKGDKPLKSQKGPPNRCTRACWKFDPPEPPDFSEIAPYTDQQIGEIEAEVLGLYLTYTPFDRIHPDDRKSFRTAHELKSVEPGEHLVAATVTSVRDHTDRRGQKMAFVNLNAQDGEIDAPVFASTWTSVKDAIKPGNLVLCVVFKQKDGRYSLRAAQAV